MGRKKISIRDIFNLNTLKQVETKVGHETVLSTKFHSQSLLSYFLIISPQNYNFFCIGLKKLWVSSIPHFHLPDMQTKLILKMQMSQNHRTLWVRKDLEEHRYLRRLHLCKRRSLQAILTGFHSFIAIETGLENSGVQPLEGTAAILVGIVSFLLWKFQAKI